MSEPADRTTLTGDTSQRVGGTRTALHHGERTPIDAELNIRRDVGLAREAFGAHPPHLTAAAARARQAQMADCVEELDGRILDLMAAAISLLIERGLGPALMVWANVQRIRDEAGPNEPRLGPATMKIAAPDGDTVENLLEVIAGGERALEMLRNAFPKLAARHTG
jgi:hypothetical protein